VVENVDERPAVQVPMKVLDEKVDEAVVFLLYRAR
jgi:hypothetical protein